ncbi:MAG: response regulator [Leptolyngbyaceae cyanobacterium MO_188.B28]|nr:response regulator [Leptolyngbyaceae cyanobacterium MO_188.B28]
MAIDPDIRDQAYQFFVQEAPELLQALETGLLTLSQEHGVAKVHDLMRAAHSIKGGAASVGLETVATLAHRLENIFKALYNESLEIDTGFENQLLQAYDCLRLPLTEQIILGYFDEEQALAVADPIFTQIEEQFGEALNQADTYLPNSAELGIDMVSSIMQVDVAEGLKRLAEVAAHPQDYEVTAELQTQVEVFAGFAEFLNLPGFGATAEAVQRALARRPDQVLEIIQLAIVDFERHRQAVLSGNSSETSDPSMALTALAESSSTDNHGSRNRSVVETTDFLNPESVIESASIIDDADTASNVLALEDVFEGAINLTERELHQADAVADSSNDILMAWEASSFNPISNPIPAHYSEPAAMDGDAGDDQAVFSQNLSMDADAIVEETVVDASSFTSETERDDTNFTTTIDLELDLEPPPSTLAEAVQSISQSFDQLPPAQNLSPKSRHNSEEDAAENPAVNTNAIRLATPEKRQGGTLQVSQLTRLTQSTPDPLEQEPINIPQGKEPHIPSNLTVRVDAERLEQINNLVGELAINRSGLSLQNEQLQSSLKALLSRFARFHSRVSNLRKLSDRMLVEPERARYDSQFSAEFNNDEKAAAAESIPRQFADIGSSATEFDPLEMDSYSALDTQLQEILEDMVQLEESVDDITLFAKQSDERLDQQHHMLTQLQDDLIWSRMLPLGEVLNRFPRILRNLSTTYDKPVNLTLTGSDVLIDKAVLEKLYTPLLHLLRNAFDHGVESPDIRRRQGKAEQGQIEIRAYHRGNQTIIEVKDDGQGLNLDRIRHRALELGWLSPERLALTPPNHLLELIFEPGFSTAHQVSKLSGRGVGLDVVRSQLRSIKGTVMVTSTPGKGATFTLAVPLTLTIFKLIIVSAGTAAIAMPADDIEEILTPQPNQTQLLGAQQFLKWREQIVPIYRLSDLLEYACPLPETLPNKALFTVPSPKDWAPPTMILRHEQQAFALQVDRLITEQELVIKPFGLAIASPNYAYGCTILGDGSVIPVINGNLLVEKRLGQSNAEIQFTDSRQPLIPLDNKPALMGKAPQPPAKIPQASTVLIVDDAFTFRQTLTVLLEKEGFRVLQARDGRDAIDQLQQGRSVQLVICDIEMPNMNGFEFLSYRRQNAQLSNIPVVMLTSRSSDKHRWLAKRLGAVDYLTKPCLEQELLETVENVLN